MPVFSLALGEAEQYLEPLGFPGDGKLELSLLGFDDPTLKGDFRDKYHCAAPEGWAPWKYINGSSFQFQVGTTGHKVLQLTPKVRCARAQQKKPTTFVMIDPDAPEPAGDGAMTGTNGPYLHWIVTGATKTTADGKEVVPWTGPQPPKGKHRYILIEFLEHDTPVFGSLERAKWDFKTFLAVNAGKLEPIAINFFFCAAEDFQEDEGGSFGFY